MKDALIIMAKAPLPGQVKTRLSPPLTLEEAAELHRCFLLDTLELALRLPGVELHLAYHPPEAEELLPWPDGPDRQSLIPPRFQMWPQEGKDLAQRLDHAFRRLLVQGHGRVVAIGADSPTLPLVCLKRAFELLRAPHYDLVLGPSEDGGYYLISLKAPCPSLFLGVPMGSDRVLSETLRRARQAGLRVTFLPTWYDVDRPQELDRLRAELESASLEVVPHTQAFLRRLTSPGVGVRACSGA